MTEHEFQNALQQAIDSFAPRMPPRPSRRVRALLLSWSIDDLKVGPEVRQMERALRTYGYSTSVLQIPAQQGDDVAQQWVANEALKLSAGLDPDDLAILYYAGHGITEPEFNGGPCVWVSGPWSTPRGPTTARVSFSVMKAATLDAASHQVLYLLDTCHAASGAVKGKKSLIAACGIRQLAQAPGNESFTSGVVRELELAYKTKKYLHVASLHNRLLYQCYRKQIRETPVASEMYDDHHTPCIYLLPLGSATATGSNTTPLGARQPRGVAVALSVELSDASTQTLQRFQSWLTERSPFNPNNIRIESVKFLNFTKTTSGIIMFKLHGAVWHCLRSHSSIRFLGYSADWEDDSGVF